MDHPIPIASEYKCEDCGQIFTDNSHNPYTGENDKISCNAIRCQVLIHAVVTGHENYTIPCTELKFTIKSPKL